MGPLFLPMSAYLPVTVTGVHLGAGKALNAVNCETQALFFIPSACMRSSTVSTASKAFLEIPWYSISPDSLRRIVYTQNSFSFSQL